MMDLNTLWFFVYYGHARCPGGGMVDTGDLKSLEGNFVRVQVPPRALTATQAKVR